MAKNLNRNISKKTNGFCAHCGRKISNLTIDHVIPQTFGGTNDQRNLMPLCATCNRDRASGEIVPETYYKYALPWALDDLQSYIFEWKLQHTRADGTMTVDRYGIQE